MDLQNERPMNSLALFYGPMDPKPMQDSENYELERIGVDEIQTNEEVVQINKQN